MKTILIVGIGGFLGSILRYLTTTIFSRHFHYPYFPYGTLVVNVFGCLLIGIIYGLAERFHVLTPHWRLFLATGFCGGFTTFSAFAYENILLLQQSNYAAFALYSIVSFALCLAAVFGGLQLIKLW